MDLDRKRFETDFEGKKLTLEISRLAEQANAAVIASWGGTAVLATAVMSHEDSLKDYLPLTVEFEERFYAAGKILGGRYMRREGKASEQAVLNARIIDRTIRPLFDQRVRRDIQVVITVLSYEESSSPVTLGLVAASAALLISDIPWNGPVAGISIKNSTWTAFVAGTAGKINMIELEGLDVPESEIENAFTQAIEEIKRLASFQNDIRATIGKPKAEVMLKVPAPELIENVRSFLKDKLEPAMYVASKTDRVANISAVQKALMAHLAENNTEEESITDAARIFEEYVDEIVHKNVCDAKEGEERRPDGRKLDEVRDLHAEIGIFERLHGSALFIRGNTQAFATVTLAPPDTNQFVENIFFTGEKPFMLHYNFPPYSTGETGSFRGPGRREIGHGNLAEKALTRLIPPQDEFPYTVRVVSEILSSNGSSSMASVCGGCLALMDAGVPIKKMAAGIAMGMMSDEKKGIYKILTDIQGPEDHYGDMDFKVAGTKDGVNAVQMDVKVDGVTIDIIKRTLDQARKARLHIMTAMEKAITKPRAELSKYAPVVMKISVNPEQIGEIIGPGGKVIKGIIEATGIINMDIRQDGDVYIYANDKESALLAKNAVDDIAHEYKIGDIIEGTVERILEFGAIVEWGNGRSGMIHVSELKNGYVKSVEEVVKLGDTVRAKIIRMEDGKIGLSLKGL
jgi:polyribonucleotide nucleotidyltransferase